MLAYHIIEDIFHQKKKLPKDAKGRIKKVLTTEQVDKILNNVDIILPKKRKYYIENLYSHYKHTLYVEPLDETRKIIEEKYPEYIYEFDKLHKRTSAHMFNMFIMKKEMLNDYCTWLFEILFELERRIDKRNDLSFDAFQGRFYGRISELLLDVWINTKGIKYSEAKVIDMQNINWINKGTSFLKAKFFGKKYENSFQFSILNIKWYNELKKLYRKLM